MIGVYNFGAKVAYETAADTKPPPATRASRVQSVVDVIKLKPLKSPTIAFT